MLSFPRATIAADNTDDIAALIDGAIHLYDLGHKQAALKALNLALESDPKNRRALYYKDVILRSLNYKRPVELGPRLLPVLPASRARKTIEV
jgi:tetratricopeptide (TPR) repeat protein